MVETQHCKLRGTFDLFLFENSFLPRIKIIEELAPPAIRYNTRVAAAQYTDKPTNSSIISPQHLQAHMLVENKPTIPTSPQARREQQQQRNLSAIIPCSLGIPAVMSNLRLHPQFESRYNALGDLSNQNGWPRRVNVLEGSFNKTNPEPVCRTQE